jgi:exodeoxyribonuclease V alpha subunit
MRAPLPARHEAPGALPPPPEIAAAAAEQDLGPELFHLAWELAAVGAAQSPQLARPLLLLALAVLAAERAGSTRLPLDPALDRLLRELGAEARDVAAARELLNAAGAALPPSTPADPGGASRILGGPGDYRPLLVDSGHLYSQRAWSLERRVGERLRGLIAAPPARHGAAVAAALADVRSRPARAADGTTIALSAEQEQAVRVALSGRLAVVTGGPGTGKTWIVAALLRVLARLGDPPLAQIALAAPTGKAADRIRASLVAALQAVAEPAPADRALLAALPGAVTLHRLLSYSPAGERFRHHERNPLGERLVIVDESSMIDLQLADHLLRSLPADGRLVLLGDARQLPAVEAGAVLRDLVAAPAAAPRVARLTRSYRMDAGDPAGRRILALAERVASGSLGAVAEALEIRVEARELTFAGPELLLAPPASVQELLEQWWTRRIRSLPGFEAAIAGDWPLVGDAVDAAATSALGSIATAYEASRLLCATRGWSGGRGVAAANEWCRARLARELPPSGRRPHADDLRPGEPVLVTRNDYARGLYNGDQGLVVATRLPTGERQLAAVFRRGDGFRAVPLAALRGRIEPAWATTVHKAQGSEHDVVALLLPAAPTRLLARELVYTAITRARRGVVIFGDEATLGAAVATASERWSGLPAALGSGVAEAGAGASAGEAASGTEGGERGDERADGAGGPDRQLALPF